MVTCKPYTLNLTPSPTPKPSKRKAGVQANGLGPLATKLTLEEAEMLAARWALGVWGSWGSRVYALVMFFFFGGVCFVGG